MRLSQQQHRRGKGGFTLAEILCALAVLSILVLLIAQLMSGASKTMTFTENHMSTDGEMRTVFASMGNDLANMMKKSNVDALFSKQTGNDYMFFYSQAEAIQTASDPSENSPLSLVGYQVFSYTDPLPPGKATLYHLERYSQGLTWDQGPIYLSYSGSSVASTAPYPPPAAYIPDGSTLLDNSLSPWSKYVPGDSSVDTANTASSNYHVIGDGVFRMEFCFLRSDGTFSDVAQIPSTPSKYRNVMTDVVALVVTVAELDPASQRLVPTMGDVVNLFPDATYSPSATLPDLMGKTWQDILDNHRGELISAGVPPSVIPKIRIYQHFFYFDNEYLHISND